MEKSFTVQEVVENLIGKIQPVGETNEDGQRLVNIHCMCDLVYDLIYEIRQAGKSSDRSEDSMKKIGMVAKNFLDNLKLEL